MQSKSQIRSIGIDLGKTTFHLIALGTRSQVVIRKKFSRSQLLEHTANLPSSLIGMEAGVGSHFLGRALREQGHEVRLIPAQFVRPFVKSNKNDYRDAEAHRRSRGTGEHAFRSHQDRRSARFAGSPSSARPVGGATDQRDQSDSSLPAGARISFRKGPASLRRQMPEILENADVKLSPAMRRLLDFLWQEWKGLQLQIENLNTELEQIAGSDPSCVRLQQIPGVGPLVSTAVVSAIGNGAAAMVNRWQGQAAGHQ